MGKTFSITTGPDGNLWIGTHPRNVINEAPGWLVNVDRKSGKVIGYVESPGLHSWGCKPKPPKIPSARVYSSGYEENQNAKALDMIQKI